ncbi:hypothetical protein [Aureibacter tunicatorum]|uniref:Outer membrane protein beta-barrel domain-containing protein n=1 Tax=Aureibacter tunicatorum TaxID=866807 RepID=A0AAE3XPW0_9BACT|nr:hypothetical protein [Aureibacter tunicatorum]MDR6240382.1 hypothetical protein [Aureibacter tunicatorum]BDD05737.1 hypothetical protein AUTU_32200 [Aureibacter tunicatorum]
MRLIKMTILCIVLLFSFCENVYAQEVNQSFEADFGISLPQHKDINQSMNLAFNGTVGLDINVLKRKLFIKPEFGIKRSSKKVNSIYTRSSGTLYEVLTHWNLGAEMSYNIFKRNSFEIRPTLSLKHNYVKNYFTYTYYSDELKTIGITGKKTAKSKHLLDGMGLSMVSGVKVRYGRLFLKVNYEIFRPYLEIDYDAIYNLEHRQVYEEKSKVRYNIDNISLTLGYSSPIKKRPPIIKNDARYNN